MVDRVLRDVVRQLLVLGGGVVVRDRGGMHNLALVDEVPEVHPVRAVERVLEALLGVSSANRRE